MVKDGELTKIMVVLAMVGELLSSNWSGGRMSGSNVVS